MSSTNSSQTQGLSYRDAGVDMEAGDALVERIKPMAKKTMREGVLAGIGGFGALFEVPKRYKEPVLVSGTDGVGTKLRLAFEWNRHETIGQDLVAMSVNDILVQGAEPLFFLDYFACGKLTVDTAATVVGGIAKGCPAAHLLRQAVAKAHIVAVHPAAFSAVFGVLLVNAGFEEQSQQCHINPSQRACYRSGWGMDGQLSWLRPSRQPFSWASKPWVFPGSLGAFCPKQGCFSCDASPFRFAVASAEVWRIDQLDAIAAPGIERMQ